MQDLEPLYEITSKMRKRLGKIVLGQETVLEHLVACFVAGGHVILEGVPGLGKTLLARTLARLTDAEFRRIQFTPDLLPSDIVGTNIFNMQTSTFSLHQGPIFTEVLLADEINRTPPKSQAALLEAMEERQVTIDGVRHPLPELFFVMATQNPVEYEGTYPLPETQLDRFMMKIVVQYPEKEAELDVIRSYAQGRDLHNLDALIPSPLMAKNAILKLRKLALKVTIKDEVMEYIRSIAAQTRDPAYVQLGASTRAAVALLQAARAIAAVRGMPYVSPEEVKEAVFPVLRHRIILRPEALIDGLTPDSYLQNVLRSVTVPR